MTFLRIVWSGTMFACAVILATPTVAFASHYDLISMEYPSADMAQILVKMGISTTESLHNATATDKGRVKLATKLGVNKAEVQKWHRLCDLLRLSGVGPRVARLFTEMGVDDLVALAKQEPGPFTGKIAAANQVHRILGKLPDEELVGIWINQARELTQKAKGSKKKSGRRL